LRRRTTELTALPGEGESDVQQLYSVLKNYDAHLSKEDIQNDLEKRMEVIITGLLRLENDSNKLFLIEKTIIHLVKRDLKGLASLVKSVIVKEVT
jgi:Na+/phosphate symporter